MFHLPTMVDSTVHTIVLTGELDHRCSSRLHEALTRLRLATGNHLVLDLAGLTFATPAGSAPSSSRMNSPRARVPRSTCSRLPVRRVTTLIDSI
ncbi:hypothetical protein ACRAKJ_20130 [Saccharothrix sp. DSM 118769]